MTVDDDGLKTWLWRDVVWALMVTTGLGLLVTEMLGDDR